MWRFVLYQLCISSAVRHKRNILGVTRPFTFSGQNLFSHPLKARVFHSQTHLGKQLGCMFSLGNWFSTVHTRKEATLLKETMCFNIHARSSCHRTPKFLWFMFMPRTTQREISSTSAIMETSVSAKCVFSGLGHSREVWWVWTCHLSSAGKSTALTPWNPHGVAKGPTRWASFTYY